MNLFSKSTMGVTMILLIAQVQAADPFVQVLKDSLKWIRSNDSRIATAIRQQFDSTYGFRVIKSYSNSGKVWQYHSIQEAGVPVPPGQFRDNKDRGMAVGIEAALERKNIADTLSAQNPTGDTVLPYTIWKDSVQTKHLYAQYVSVETWLAAREAGVKTSELEEEVRKAVPQILKEWKRGDTSAKKIARDSTLDEREIQDFFARYDKIYDATLNGLNSKYPNPQDAAQNRQEAVDKALGQLETDLTISKGDTGYAAFKQQMGK